MPNLLKFDQDARDALLKGLNTVADAVSATLGPKGRNVAIEQGYGTPLVIHDGVTVARRIVLKDPFENMGAQLVKDAAQKTNDKAGDGTTTATILAQAIANEAMKQIQSGANAQTLKKGIEEALKLVLEELKKLAKEVKTDEELEQVATISSTDPDLGKLIAQAIKKVGKDGVVTVEEGSGFETAVEYKEGMEIDRGYLSPYFVTDQSRVEASLDNPYILLTDKKISHSYELVPFLEKFVAAGKVKDLVIIASEVNDEALAMLVVNKLKGTFNVLAIQAPAFGGRRIDELEDLAALTGGHVVTQDSGRELESVEFEELGQAGRVTSDRDRTIITDGKGDPKAIKARKDDLQSQLLIANTDFDKDIKKQRLAKLAGGVAVINVGATTEVEMKEKKERVIDAVNATKAAIEEGIVAGGEITLYGLSTLALEKQNLGASILFQALRQPFRKLVENAGINFIDAEELIARGKYPFGLDVEDKVMKDMVKAGIIDPVKVTRSALENAVSIAVMIMTNSVLIVDERETK